MANYSEKEEELAYKSDFNLLPPPDIIAYNELRSCSDLVRMYKEKYLDIQPDFQRDFVWPAPAQTRFIDSIIKQLPIPSMCFSLDYQTQKWQVIDGLQRISTIIRFFEDDEWILSSLDDIDPNISGKPVKDFREITSPLNIYYERIKNLTLPITVIRCDLTKPEHTEYLFTIFHRLNVGGTKLTNQEIRNAIYTGPFNTCLIELNTYEYWIKINKIDNNKSYRFKHEELILRFFAFFESLDNYEGNLTSFLNKFMERHRDDKDNDHRKQLFRKVIDMLYQSVFDNPDFKISATVLETLMYAIAKNIDVLITLPPLELKKRCEFVMDDDSLSTDSLKENLSGKEKVKTRLLNAAKNVIRDK